SRATASRAGSSTRPPRLPDAVPSPSSVSQAPDLLQEWAAWAVDQAQLAVLDAADARTWADACAAARS
ncbi:MAG TPA: hypothetical protein VJ371_03295, partial [Streptosporangiaceae bacterium]|nr:hypothetical protein [Streptosporangiaceae bacterium]